MIHPTRSPITTLVDFIIGPITIVSDRSLTPKYLGPHTSKSLAQNYRDKDRKPEPCDYRSVIAWRVVLWYICGSPMNSGEPHGSGCGAAVLGHMENIPDVGMAAQAPFPPAQS